VDVLGNLLFVFIMEKNNPYHYYHWFYILCS